MRKRVVAMQVEVRGGTHIDEAADEMWRLAVQLDCVVQAAWGVHFICVHPEMDRPEARQFVRGLIGLEQREEGKDD